MALAERFGLNRDPFARTVDPADAFESQAFAGARDGVLRDLVNGARLIALVGAAGTGKTLLLRAIEAALTHGGRQVRRLDRGDLLADTPGGDVLLIDEADRISDAALMALAHGAADRAHPAIVLALTRRRLDHLDLPVTPHTVTLDELGSNDAREFVVDRVRRAGGDPALFTPGAIGALTYAAAGSPRLLRLLASGALFQATQDDAARVEMGHARRAIAMQRGGTEPPVPPVPPADPEPLVLSTPVGAAPPPPPLAVSPRAERLTVAPAPEPPRPAVDTEPKSVAMIPPPRLDPDPVAEIEDEAPQKRRWLLPATAGLGLAVLGGAFLMLLSPDPAGRPAAAPAAAPLAAPTRAPDERVEPPRAPAAAPPAPAPEPQPVPEPTSEAAPIAAVEPASETTDPAEPQTPAAAPPPRIIVRHADGQPGAAEAAGRIADLLQARGYETEIRAASGRIRAASARYAPGERSAGEAINSAFETVLRAYQPGAVSRASPSADGAAARGTVELWVPDSAAGAARPLRTDLPPE